MHSRIVLATIRGRVQGVGFRAWTQREAQRRGLRGWVRNRRDGAVEALLCGPDDAVAAMLDALRAGPASARVETLAVEEADEAAVPEPGSGRFEVRPTA